ncbi:nucleoplasmin-2 isoform X2 [Macaca fascicularis]|nr:nucleoplasmin-2 isoform X2 [Macaca mulatta]XP_045253945.1 nucleoplasmin-2 isoform X2 [Macaca fascicularis]XP_045253946.1 nucleoplasmin-2 isoform X2 [Macaca fascicularis]
MNLSSASSTEEKAVTTVLWGCELSQERRTWTFRPQLEGKQNCRLLLHTICLGEKAKEEMHRVEILPPANQEDKKMQPVTIASLQASVLPMVTMVGVQLSPPVTFQLRAGSGPVFLCGQERYEASDLTWEEEEEEEGEEEEEEEEDDEDEDADVSLEEESPVKQVKRLVPQKQTSVAKKKKLEKEQEETRASVRDKSPAKKGGNSMELSVHQSPGPRIPPLILKTQEGFCVPTMKQVWGWIWRVATQTMQNRRRMDFSILAIPFTSWAILSKHLPVCLSFLIGKMG